MRTFFRGREAVYFSVLCAAGIAAGAAAATANPQGRPGDAYSSPRAGNSYSCAAQATVADTVADCDQLRSRGRGSVWKAAVGLAVADADIALRSRTC